MAQQRSHVPKFGNWESEENVPYTAYFDKARKGRTGTKIINPNDPAENPDILNYGSSAGAPTSRARPEQEKPVGHGAVRPAHERQRSREDDDLRQFVNSPAHHDNLGRKAVNDSAHQQHGARGTSSGETYRRPVRQSAGSEQSIERSPIHRHARVSGRDSPSWEGKNSYDSSHGTPGRSRLRPRSDDTPDQGAAVPKFGEWDENNPSSADGFTHIFNKVREERHIGVGKVTGTPERSYPSSQKPDANANAKGCCFPWCRK
ncbi:RPM1-interacting protein 4 [Ziziphus jujuba]|uniref:RPM1-interacting protein 4 n=1 Tax=Ziziphus jujuba TaxID=326968 RepID=A0A6P4A981_ZIZJJ|nr:RPM1-interacting protein 4 [Ziziphus jujuba]